MLVSYKCTINNPLYVSNLLIYLKIPKKMFGDILVITYFCSSPHR